MILIFLRFLHPVSAAKIERKLKIVNSDADLTANLP